MYYINLILSIQMMCHSTTYILQQQSKYFSPMYPYTKRISKCKHSQRFPFVCKNGWAFSRQSRSCIRSRSTVQVLLRKWYSYVLLILIKTRRQEYLWSYSLFQVKWTALFDFSQEQPVLPYTWKALTLFLCFVFFFWSLLFFLF